MTYVATNSRGEIVDVTEADQFQFAQGKRLSEFECGFFACAIARSMSQPGLTPTLSPTQVITNAEAWYAQYNGDNSASNTAGMSAEQEYALLGQIGLHYQALPLEIELVKQWLAWGYPVLLAVSEASVHDLALGVASPYPWAAVGSHIILATGLGSGNTLLVRDSANCASLNDPASLRPGPRIYDAGRLSLVGATVVTPPWRPRPAHARALPNADMQIPTGWADDGEKLSAPNGISIQQGFRAYILAHRWHPGDIPLAAEAGANPVEMGDPSSGSGTRLVTRYSELIWTASRGVYNASVGREFYTALSALASLPSTPVPAPIHAGGGPGEQDVHEIRSELLAAARMIGDLATHLLARVNQL